MVGGFFEVTAAAVDLNAPGGNERAPLEEPSKTSKDADLPELSRYNWMQSIELSHPADAVAKSAASVSFDWPDEPEADRNALHLPATLDRYRQGRDSEPCE
jgi:hypothetical protein